MNERLPLPQPTPIKTEFGGTVLAYGADQMRQYADDANAALRERVKMLEDALRGTVRELQACQSVIHLAGGFDPAYVSDAKVALKSARAALEKTK